MLLEEFQGSIQLHKGFVSIRIATEFSKSHEPIYAGFDRLLWCL